MLAADDRMLFQRQGVDIMDQETRRQFLNEAIRIGDELLSLAEHDENGMSWKTMSIDRDSNLVWHKSENIYSGVAGIALFFLELYRQTANATYLNVAIEGMRWVEWSCQNNPSNDYAFFTGRMGVAYSMLKMADVAKDNGYLEKALTIAKPCLAFLDSATVVDDLLNGTSGALLGLLHLHAATGEKWILAAINLFVEHLLHRAYHGPAGLYWDRSAKSIRGLCGFSHGAAGIGFVFLELGHYFQNEVFYWLAEQAFLYESCFVDEAKKNWPDFRKEISTPQDFQEHEKAYLQGDLDFFIQSGDMNAWCHGAAGIGLSRLRAFELLNEPLYEREARIALEKTRLTSIESENPHLMFVLCHGACGNAELFLESFRTFGDEGYLSLAGTVAFNTLKSKTEQGGYLSGYGYRYGRFQEDTSLFMGKAGIGYFFLRLLAPCQVASILAPKVASPLSENEDVSSSSYLTVSLATVHRIVMEKIFKRTLFVLQDLIPGEIKAYFENQPTNRTFAKQAFVAFLERVVPALPQREQERVADILALELEKMRVDEAIKSHSLMYIKQRVRTKQATELMNVKGVLDLRLILDPDTKIKVTDWNWSLGSSDQWINNLNIEPEAYPVMMRPADKKVVETELSPFVYAVLTAFQNGNHVNSVVQEMTSIFGAISDEQAETIKEAVVQQIKQGLWAGVLVEE